MGTRSRGGYKRPENEGGKEDHRWEPAPRKMILTGKRHRRFTVPVIRAKQRAKRTTRIT